MILVITPPSVSMPSESGETSRSNSSPFKSPCKLPAWIAAPMATTSSGFTVAFDFLPKNFSTACCTSGMRVMPPTRITSLMSDVESFASASAFLQGSSVSSTSSPTSCSSVAREILRSRCLGPAASDVMNGWLISVSIALDNSIFAFSAASLMRCNASLSFDKSTPSAFLNSSTIHRMIFWSKSSPPKCVSPLVARTSIVFCSVEAS